ncbi:MAG: hypothetical protein R3F65_07015 [bacterium]|nr:hypothetical protein [Myxococcales bacterium]
MSGLSTTGALSGGEVLGAVARVWRANVIPISVIGLVFALPHLAFSTVARALDDTVRDLLQMALLAAMASLMTATLTFGVIDCLDGGRMNAIDSVTRGLWRWVGALKAGMLAGLGAGVGLALLIVPGVFAMCVWAVAVPVAVAEQVDSPLARSATLTEGRRWQVFFAGFLVLVVLLVVNGVFARVAISITGTDEARDAVHALLMAPLQPAWSILAIVLYRRLREAREGAPAAALAEVFD